MYFELQRSLLMPELNDLDELTALDEFTALLRANLKENRGLNALH